MKPLHILTVVGARPQFVKAAVVSAELRRTGRVRETILHTGQHYDPQLSEVFFAELDLPRPDWNLGVGSGPHGQQTGRMLEAIEGVLRDAGPDLVLVYGDTNSTLAGALAAAKLQVPVAHVEAGLRSFNRAMPEEVNRILTDHLASHLFAPTTVAMGHLAREGIPHDRCHLVGDVMYDSMLRLAARAQADSTVLERERLDAGGFILATIHRAENTESADQLELVLGGLARAGVEMPVVLPLHPRTRVLLAGSGVADRLGPGLRFMEPVGYLDMLALEGAARLVVTDSGGVQKEAFFQRVPCLTLRHETEWTELVEAGWNRLVPPVSEEAIATAIVAALRAARPAEPGEPLYGGGQAGRTIAGLLVAGAAMR